METEINRLVDQAIAAGEAQHAYKVLRAALARIERSSNLTYKSIYDFYRDHGFKLDVEERRWIGYLMAEASKGFVKDADAREARHLARRYEIDAFI